MKLKFDYRVVGAAVAIAGGCSLIYNPSNIADPKQDAIPVDAAADADPSMLVLLSSDTTTVNEAEGSGCRPNVLVIRGHNFVSSNMTVSVAVHAGQPDLGSGNPVVTLDATQLAVAGDGDTIAIPISVNQSDAFKGSNAVRYDVTVSQDAQSGRVTQTLTKNPDPSGNGIDKAALVVQGLDELRGSAAVTIPSMDIPPVYSLVDIFGIANGAGSGPVRIHAISSVKIATAVNFSGNGSGSGGPGGPNGGTGANLLGGGVTAGDGPAGGGGAVGGGAGKYVGDNQISTFATGNNRSSSGGGGGGGVLGPGGAGGGGGGELEIGAGGDITILSIAAKGGTGVTSGAQGGAGTGGVVVLRSGGVATVSGSGVDVSPGTGAGNGDPGRIRIGGNTISATATPKYFRSPTWDPTTPMVVRKEQPILVVNGEPSQMIQYSFTNSDGTDSLSGTQLVPPTGMLSFTPTIKLYRGLNKICVYVDGASAGDIAGGQCVWLAYIQPMQ